MELQGVVLEDGPSSSTPASSVAISVLNGDGELYSQAQTNQEGLFRANAPSGEAVHVFVEDADGYISSFRGVVGMNPRTRIPTGFAHTFGEAARTYWLPKFTGCPELEEGAFTIGQVLVDLVEESTGQRPAARTAKVQVFNEYGEYVADACYLNKDIDGPDLDAETVGDSGYFGVFGLPAGRHILRVSNEIVPDEVRLYEFDIFLGEDTAAPRFPILLPFEI